MKNRAKKIIAVGLGVCVLVLLVVLLLFATKPYTEKIVIGLSVGNYELENEVKNEVVSIMPTPIDNPHQSNEVFYSEIGMESFKRLFGNSRTRVSVKIEDTSYSNPDYYLIIYQTKYDCAGKSLIVVAQEHYRYKKRTLLEMRIRGRELFLKNKRDTDSMYIFSIIAFMAIATAVSLYWASLNMPSKQSND